MVQVEATIEALENALSDVRQVLRSTNRINTISQAHHASQEIDRARGLMQEFMRLVLPPSQK